MTQDPTRNTPLSRFNILSDTMSIGQIFFVLVGVASFLGAFVILLYQLWGLATGQGWNTIYLAHALFFVFGDAPALDQISWPLKIMSLFSMAPLMLVLMIMGWLFMKISDGFERLS
jgi:hypothetical protein